MGITWKRGRHFWKWSSTVWAWMTAVDFETILSGRWSVVMIVATGIVKEFRVEDDQNTGVKVTSYSYFKMLCQDPPGRQSRATIKSRPCRWSRIHKHRSLVSAISGLVRRQAFAGDLGGVAWHSQVCKRPGCGFVTRKMRGLLASRGLSLFLDPVRDARVLRKLGRTHFRCCGGCIRYAIRGAFWSPIRGTYILRISLS